MRNSSKTVTARRVQYGALPYRVSNGSRAEFMLVTSRETRRWIIPKGWPKKGKSPHQLAAREAFEEAGVRGSIAKRSVGSFSYKKGTRRRGHGRVRSARLSVEGKTPEQGMAGEKSAQGQVASCREGRRESQGADVEQAHTPAGASLPLTWPATWLELGS